MKRKLKTYVRWLCPCCNNLSTIDDISFANTEARDLSYGPCIHCGWEGSYHKLAKGNHQDFSKLESFIQSIQVQA